MPMYAQDVKIDPTLSGALSGVGSPGYNAYNQIGSNYGAARKKLGSAAAPGSYADQRLSATQGLDVGNLETALAGGLGDTAYKNKLSERGYNQNVGLANEIGSLNKPDLLQQIFGGIGAVGGPLATYAGMKGRTPLGGGRANPYMASYPSVSDYADMA